MTQKPNRTSHQPQADHSPSWKTCARNTRGWIAGGAAAVALVESALFSRAIARRRLYGELALPVVIIAGDGDLIVHEEKHSERLVGDVADAELRVIPSHGHLFHYAVPGQAVAAIGEVIERAGRSAALPFTVIGT